MELDRLNIEREKWGERKGLLTGRVRFMDGSENAIELQLTPELSERFMEVIGEALTESAKILQAKLIDNLVCFQSTARTLPAPGDD